AGWQSTRADHATGDARAGVAGGLAGVVVGVGMHDHRLADRVVGRAAAEHHALGMPVDRRNAFGIRRDVVHVAAVVGGGVDLAVRRAGRVEVAARAAGVGGAAIALLVDVDAVAAVGLEPADLAGQVQ